MYYYYSYTPEIDADGFKIREYTGSEDIVGVAHESMPRKVIRIDGEYFYTQAAGGELKWPIKEYIFRKVHKG
jgi:hypothetical protein